MRSSWSPEKETLFQDFLRVAARKGYKIGPTKKSIGVAKDTQGKDRGTPAEANVPYSQSPTKYQAQDPEGESPGVSNSPQTDMIGLGRLFKELLSGRNSVELWLVFLLRKAAGFTEDAEPESVWNVERMNRLAVDKEPKVKFESVTDYQHSLELALTDLLNYQRVPLELKHQTITVQFRDVFDTAHCLTVSARNEEVYPLFLQTNFMVVDDTHRAIVWFEQDRHNNINLCFCLRFTPKPLVLGLDRTLKN